MNLPSDRSRLYQRIALLIAGVLAFLMRFVLLGKVPLIDNEAVNALQALGISQASGQGISGDAGYVLLTSALFFVFGAGEAAARVWPAIAGTLLALTPWGFRRQLGENAAILMCFGLALDAGWVAISRQASSLSWGALFLVLAVLALVNKKSRLLGVFTALALLGGSGFWQGILGLAIAYGIYQWAFKPQPTPDEESSSTSGNIFQGINLREGGLWLMGSMLVLGTMLFLVPNGLSAAADGLVQAIQGWTQAGTITVPRLLLGLVVSQTLGFLFAIVALIRVFRTKDPLDTFLLVWWITALAFTLIYPAKQMVQMGWALLPMIALASRQLAVLITPAKQFKGTVFAYSAIVVVLLVFAWLTFISYFQPARPEVSTTVRILTTIFPLFILIGAAFVIRWYWNEETAGQGALWGLVGVLAIWGISAAWGATGLGLHPEGQLWRTGPMIDEVDLLHSTVADLSSWKMRAPGELELVVDNIDSPALRWALRDYRLVQYATSTASVSSPPMVITTEEPSPELAGTYRGQDFVLEVSPTWQMSLDEWLQWVAYKTVPVTKTNVILWARADLFPDAAGFNP